jgi:hypothetical protein
MAGSQPEAEPVATPAAVNFSQSRRLKLFFMENIEPPLKQNPKLEIRNPKLIETLA